MRAVVTPEDLVGCGVNAGEAERIAAKVIGVFNRHGAEVLLGEENAWAELQRGVLQDRGLPFEAHRFIYEAIYEGRDPTRVLPAPAWIPTREEVERTNVAGWMAELGIGNYGEFYRWTVQNRDEFWDQLIRRTKIRFKKPPRSIRDPKSDETKPSWLPGAELNISDSCFQTTPAKPAILYGREGSDVITRTTYGELENLTNRTAYGLDKLGLGPRDRVALYLPMTPEAVAIYLAVIRSGRAVVGIADASAPQDVEKRLGISDAKLVFTIDSYMREGKELKIYDKAVRAHAPRAVVLPSEGSPGPPTPLRSGDVSWKSFLTSKSTYESVARSPSDATNILFSSGTTKDPKAIVWTHTTPLKCIADAYCHHDVQADDVLAWPTTFGWMMGPWLTYAGLVHGATIALYNGAPTNRGFCQFVEEAKVTMLGLVPKLVRAWKTGRVLDGIDWRGIRRFSSTGETSTPEEMFWLMHVAGYKPIIEYCGGTEIGGGYITGSMLQPGSPATFTTPSVGLDFYILDEDGGVTDRGEVGIVPPSIGLSNELLNYDHRKEYFEGMPPGPDGEILRRHGDQVERLGGGYFRHHGRMDDTINLNGVKTSSEELRSVLQGHPLVYDTKPIAFDAEGTRQRVLVVYVVPKDKSRLGDAGLRTALQKDFQKSIKERLNPLLAHVHDVVLVADLPQAGPGKTRTTKEFVKDYQARRSAASAVPRR